MTGGAEKSIGLMAICLIAGLLFFAGSFYYKKDLAKVERVALRLENGEKGNEALKGR